MPSHATSSWTNRSTVPDGLSTRLPFVALGIVQLGMALFFLLNRAPGTGAALVGLPLDDSWIHLVYARSLADFRGFAYNPGELESGFTSPAWVLVLTPGFWLHALGVPYMAWVKVAGVAAGWLCSASAYSLSRRLTGHRVDAWACALLISLEPWLAFSNVSGMEVPLASATMMLALWALASERFGLAGFVLALAGCTRPEAAPSVGIAVLVLGHLAWRRRQLRGVILVCIPALLAGAVWVAYCLLVTGHPLPSTFYAKHSHVTLTSLARNVAVYVQMIADLPAYARGVGVLFFVLGVDRLLRYSDTTRTAATRWTVALLLVHPMVLLGALAWTHSMGQPRAFYWHRYFEPVVPFLLLPVGIGIAWLARAATRRLQAKSRFAAGTGVLSIALCCLPFVQLPAALLQRADLFSWNCQNINEVQVALGQWLAVNADAGATVAATDVGAIRFFAERRVLDELGLNSHEILFEGRTAVLARERPTYFVLPLLRATLAPSHSFRLYSRRSRHYSLCACPGQEEYVIYAVRPTRTTVTTTSATTSEALGRAMTTCHAERLTKARP